jgi:signal transduction histidine kinase
VFEKVRIHNKVAVAMAIPLLALAGVSTVTVTAAARDVTDAEAQAGYVREQVALARAVTAPASLLSTLQSERNAEAIRLLDQPVTTFTGPSDQSAAAVAADMRRLDDTAIAEFQAQAATWPTPLHDIYAPLVAVLTEVGSIREESDRTPAGTVADAATVAAITGRYTAVIDRLFESNTRLTVAVEDPRMRAGVNLVDAVARDKEYGTVLTRLIRNADLNAPDRAVLTPIVEMQTKVDVQDKVVAANATAGYEPIVRSALENSKFTTYRSLVRDVVAGRGTDSAALVGPRAVQGWEVFAALDSAVAAQLEADAVALETAAAQQVEDAESRLHTATAVSLLAVALGVVIAVVARGWIGRPVRRTATDVRDLAERRLPETVDALRSADGLDEVPAIELAGAVGDGSPETIEVAQAINAVGSVALDLAAERATLRHNVAETYVNLGRRNQDLISRHLDTLDELNGEHLDPRVRRRLDTLGHLASRMRRNAESLLLLGGLEPQRPEAGPVPLRDVVEAIISEAGAPDRVDIPQLDSVHVDGATVPDLMHILAELLDNALAFSPPDRKVEIEGRKGRLGYALAIVDDGVGMTADELVWANARLTLEERLAPESSDRLGLYVVGLQAARLGLGVRLIDSPAGGVTAQVRIDALVRSSRPAVGTPAPTAAVRTAEAQPAGVGAQGGDTAPEVTASGYKKRVRGARTPRTTVMSVRTDDGAADGAMAADDAPSSPVGDLFGGFAAGTERALAELSRLEDER